MHSARDDPSGRVSPFGYPRIKVCSRLPMAFRSVPRPSSPLSAKASTRCPFALDCRAVAYRGKPHQHNCSDFTQLILAPCSQHSKAPTAWGQDCNLFTMSNNDARRANPEHEYLISAVLDRCPRSFGGLDLASPRKIGGAGRDRTDDLLLAKQALSQLSYSPDRKAWWAWEDLNFRPHAYQARALTN